MNFHASLTRQKWKCRMVGVFRGSHGRHRMVVGPLQFVPITPTVVSSNPVHGEVYSIQHYVIKFVSDLRQVGGFLRVLLFPPPIKLTATMQVKYYCKWRYTP
jgi:hypothetical protein